MRTRAVMEAKRADERVADERATALLTVESAVRGAVHAGVSRRGVLRFAAVAAGFQLPATPTADQ